MDVVDPMSVGLAAAHTQRMITSRAIEGTNSRVRQWHRTLILARNLRGTHESAKLERVCLSPKQTKVKTRSRHSGTSFRPHVSQVEVGPCLYFEHAPGDHSTGRATRPHDQRTTSSHTICCLPSDGVCSCKCSWWRRLDAVHKILLFIDKPPFATGVFIRMALLKGGDDVLSEHVHQAILQDDICHASAALVCKSDLLFSEHFQMPAGKTAANRWEVTGLII